MNTLKTEKTIYCGVCGCSMKRTKSVKVNAETKEQAVIEATEKFKIWLESLKGQNCKTCQSIINDLKQA